LQILQEAHSSQGNKVRREKMATTTKDAKKSRFNFKEYFKSVKVEMKKVVWPTKKETISYTAVVIATCAAFALLFWAIDTGVLAALKSILNITL
jgi:preprotein translocase subunit SecE